MTFDDYRTAVRLAESAEGLPEGYVPMWRIQRGFTNGTRAEPLIAIERYWREKMKKEREASHERD